MALQNTTPTYCCLVLQQQLENIMGSKAPGNIVQETGFLNALISPQNTTGFESVESNAFPGKGMPASGQARPQLEVRYLKPMCETTTNTVLGLCGTQANSTDPYGYKRVEFRSDPIVAGVRVTQADFDRICEGRDERITEVIRRKALGIRYEAERQLITRFYAQAGNYPGGANSATSPITLPIMGVTDGGQPYANAASLMAIKSAYRRMHTQDAPIVVGDDALARHFDLRSMAGLGSNALFANPLDYGGITPVISLFLDDAVNTAGGTGNHALSFLPGSVQLLTWNAYTGDREILGKEDYTKTTINIDGITYDYTINYDKCDDVWDIELSLNWELLNLTDETSPCYDFNYLLHWDLNCGPTDCDFLLPTSGSSVV